MSPDPKVVTHDIQKFYESMNAWISRIENHIQFATMQAHCAHRLRDIAFSASSMSLFLAGSNGLAFESCNARYRSSCAISRLRRARHFLVFSSATFQEAGLIQTQHAEEIEAESGETRAW